MLQPPEATKSLLFDVTHLDERVRLSGRDKMSLQPPEATKSLLFEKDEDAYELFNKNTQGQF